MCQRDIHVRTTKGRGRRSGYPGVLKVWFYIDGWKSLPDLMAFQERLGGNEETVELLGRRVIQEKKSRCKGPEVEMCSLNLGSTE